MRIDVHAHHYPDAYWKAIVKLSETIAFPPDVRRILTYFPKKGVLVKAEETIGPMEKAGIGIQVLSLSIPNVYMPDRAMSLDLAQMANDAFAEIRRRFPERFYVLASVPLHFPDLAIRELDRAIGKLGMNGVVLGSNIAGRALSSPEFFPFYERVNQLKLPILIHPMSPPHADEDDEFFTTPLVNYLFESTLAVTKMVFAGVFERFPDMALIVPHLGGAVPYIQGRIDSGYRNHPPCRKNISMFPSEYFRKFYYDTVSFNTPALRCALEIVGPEHLVFGTDTPFQPIDNIPLINDSLDALGLSTEDREAIDSENLLRILHRP